MSEQNENSRKTSMSWPDEPVRIKDAIFAVVVWYLLDLIWAALKLGWLLLHKH